MNKLNASTDGAQNGAYLQPALNGAPTNTSDRAKARLLDTPTAHTAIPLSGHLSPLHREKLRTLPSEIIQVRQYATVEDSLTLEKHGFPASMNPALLIPWHNVEGEIGGYQIRPNVPRKVKGKEQKYLFPKGRKNFADVPPICLSELKNPKKPLWIVEGAIKADFLAACGACAVGLAGVTGWIFTNEEGGKTAIPCFRSIALNGRVVYICFDSDLKHKATIRKQAMELRNFLESKGARVFFVDIPDTPEGQKQGPDDFLMAGGTLEQLQSFAVSDAPKDSDGQRSQADILMEIAVKEAKVFRNDREEIFASVEQNGQTVNLRVRSMAFRSWLNVRHYEIYGHVASSKGAADSVISTLDGIARRTSYREIYTRVASTEDAVFYDLADEEGRAVKITAQGWEVITRPPVAFYRPKGTRPQVLPQRGGNIGLLRQVINIKSEDFALVAAWLLAFFQPRGPRPHVGIVAEQGSGKSMATSLFRRLLDPNAVPTRKEPKEARDLMIAAKSNALLAFDNLSFIPGWLSDSLCCLATGAGYATRALYSDDDEEIFAVQRPVIFNAITDVATRPDLLDRTILLELPRVSETARKDEQEIEGMFTQCAPLILGAIFDAVAVGLRNLPDTHPQNLPRMADFAKWVIACAPAVGMSEKQFTDAYKRNRETVGDLVAEISTVLQVFEEWAEQQYLPTSGIIFNDTTTKLLAMLNQRATLDLQKAPDWPNSARALGREIKRLAPVLRARGWDIMPSKNDGNRAIKIRKSGSDNEAETLDPTSQSSLELEDFGNFAVPVQHNPILLDLPKDDEEERDISEIERLDGFETDMVPPAFVGDDREVMVF